MKRNDEMILQREVDVCTTDVMMNEMAKITPKVDTQYSPNASLVLQGELPMKPLSLHVTNMKNCP